MAYKRTIGLGASEDRLENLILERLTKGADKEKIDQRIWDLFGEEWCVMFTDLSGFSRGVEKFGIIHFLQTIHESERVLVPIIESHDGILLKAEGDSLLVIFRNADKALDAAVMMQNELKIYNQDRIPEEQILLCVGLGFGKVLKIGDADVFGSEVNMASKLGEDTAEIGEILVTPNVFDKVKFESYAFEEISNPPAGTNKAYRFLYK